MRSTIRCSSLLVSALAVLSTTSAFSIVTPPSRIMTQSTTFSPSSSCLFAGDRESQGAAIAKPDVKIAQKTKVVTKTRQKVNDREPPSYDVDDPVFRGGDDDFEDAPLYQVLLIGDDSYTAEHFVNRACAIVEDMDEDRAVTVLEAANTAGKAVVGKYPLETAETYKEQFIRSDPIIYADIQDENKIN